MARDGVDRHLHCNFSLVRQPLLYYSNLPLMLRRALLKDKACEAVFGKHDGKLASPVPPRHDEHVHGDLGLVGL